jgi:hypothetical protein
MLIIVDIHNTGCQHVVRLTTRTAVARAFTVSRFHISRQCRLCSLATIARTCIAHLLLLWDKTEARRGAVKSTCKGHTGRALFSKRSNKEACSMKTQWLTAHMSTQDGVTGDAYIVVWQCLSMPPDTAPSASCQYALAKRCLVGTRNM